MNDTQYWHAGRTVRLTLSDRQAYDILLMLVSDLSNMEDASMRRSLLDVIRKIRKARIAAELRPSRGNLGRAAQARMRKRK
jgi:hypothetical protein